MRRIAALLAVGVVAAGCRGAATDVTADSTSLSSTTVSATPTTRTPPAQTTTTSAATTQPPPVAAAFPPPQAGNVAMWVPEILATVPHDTGAFTQGLIVHDEVIYESTGLYGESTLRQVDLETGEVTRRVELDDTFFGEGLELVDGTLVQLTWQQQTAIVWDAETFSELNRFSYEGEGWGLCADGDVLVLSDGTPTLRFYDPASFELVDEVAVTRDGEPVFALNELECVGGLVFANVWMTTDIVVIDPATGDVVAVVDAASLDEVDDPSGGAVLNGIAYDETRDVFLLTGKLWPTIYVVRFVAG
jgi:glutamine cyclotransferase